MHSAGGRLNKFNITKQSKDYDLDGTYLRHWIPELRNVPASRIHEPWLMSKAEMVTAAAFLNFPSPLMSLYLRDKWSLRLCLPWAESLGFLYA